LRKKIAKEQVKNFGFKLFYSHLNFELLHVHRDNDFACRYPKNTEHRRIDHKSAAGSL